MSTPERDRAVTEAAEELVRALDICVPDWREETLGALEDGDSVNAAWDDLVAALEGSETPGDVA